MPSKKKRGNGGIGPDGSRIQYSPGGGQLRDRGNRSQKPKTNVTTFRYGKNQAVQGGVKRRAQRRLKAVGPVSGVNAKDGITGGEARKIRREWVQGGRPAGGSGGQNRRPAPGPRPTPLLDSLTELQYGGQQRQLDSERRISDQQMVNNQDWYGKYQQQVQQAAASQQAYTKGLQDAAYQQTNQAATADQGQNALLLQQQQASAAQRGTTVDPSVAQNMQAGVAARQAQGTAGGTLLAQQGQAQGAYLQNRVGVAGAQGIQAQQDEQRRRAKVESLARELEQEKGAFRVKTAMDIRQQRHTNRLENAAFGLDVREQSADEADDAADNARMTAAERRQQREARSRMRDRRHDNRLADSKEQRIRDQDLADDGKLNGSSGGSGKKGSFTPTQVRTGRRNLRNLVGRVKNNVDPPDSVDPLLAQAAVQIADKGGVTPALARKIKRQYGFTPKVRRPGPHDIGATPGPLGPK